MSLRKHDNHAEQFHRLNTDLKSYIDQLRKMTDRHLVNLRKTRRRVEESVRMSSSLVRKH